MAELTAKEKDALILVRVQKRLQRAFTRRRSWRGVAADLGVNHFYIAWVRKGNIPTSKKVRKALGFPCVMPSERRVYKRQAVPLLGSEGWEKIFFKRLTPRKKWR